MEKGEADRKRTCIWAPRWPIVAHCQRILIRLDPVTPAPVPWCLAWCEDGELDPQDRFDLLQNLVASESPDVQPLLIAAVERMSLVELTVMAATDVTGLCA